MIDMIAYTKVLVAKEREKKILREIANDRLFVCVFVYVREIMPLNANTRCVRERNRVCVCER